MRYSVVTACLNSADTISRTIQSVLKQSEPPLEYFFVDGGSTDGTPRIISDAIGAAKSLNTDTSFKVIRQESKGGIYEAWNMALEEATGDVIFILNSDDWYVDDAASYVMSRFREDSRLEILMGAGRYLSSAGDANYSDCKVRSFLALPFAMTVVHPAFYVKRTVYQRVGLFDSRYKIAGDYDFVYRCRIEGVKFRKVDKVLVHILTGGFAEKNRAAARSEVFEIGSKYSCLRIFPWLAYISRVCLRK